MAKTAAYVAIQDSTTSLGVGGDIDHTVSFDAPGLDASARSVLTYRVAPVVDDDDVTLEVSVNGTVVSTSTFHSNDGRPWQEILDADLLKAKDNKLTARVTDTDKVGAITISDIVLMYTNA